MSFVTRYCSKCGQTIRDGGDGHLFRCPPPRPEWPPTPMDLAKLGALAKTGHEHARAMLDAHELGKLPSVKAIDWYLQDFRTERERTT